MLSRLPKTRMQRLALARRFLQRTADISRDVAKTLEGMDDPLAHELHEWAQGVTHQLTRLMEKVKASLRQPRP